MAEERKKCSCNCHLNPALKRCKLEEKSLFGRFTNFTLPGYHYLGPGGNSTNGPPTNIVDAIAKEHDLAYDQAVDDFKKTHNEEESAEEIKQADERFLQEISEIKINSTKEAIGKVIGVLGIGLKAAIERSLGYTLYPVFGNSPDEEDDCSLRAGDDFN